MECADFYNRVTRDFPEAFAANETLKGFSDAIQTGEPGLGRVLQNIFDKHPNGGWLSSYYRTIKTHGFVAKPLLMPDARKVTDLFDDVSLYLYHNGGRTLASVDYVRAGAAFVSATRAKGFAYFGPLGATYSLRDDKVRCQRGGTQYLTGATPKRALTDAYGYMPGPGEWDLSTFEIVRRDDGKQLVIANCHNGFGRQWVALLDADETALSMLDDHERGEIEAEYARQVEAWGARSGERA